MKANQMHFQLALNYTPQRYPVNRKFSISSSLSQQITF